jgi:hypothetical protein
MRGFDDANVFNTDLVEHQIRTPTERIYKGNIIRGRSMALNGRTNAEGSETVYRTYPIFALLHIGSAISFANDTDIPHTLTSWSPSDPLIQSYTAFNIEDIHACLVSRREKKKVGPVGFT